jgi:hypothetical protein
MDPGQRSEWAAVEERWAKITRDPDSETWSGRINAPVSRSRYWRVAIVSLMGPIAAWPLCVTLIEPARPDMGTNAVMSQEAPLRPRWVEMLPSQNDWSDVRIAITHPTGEAYTHSDRLVIRFEVAWVAE